MRNLIVLGASALVLALGVAQASAIPTTEVAGTPRPDAQLRLELRRPARLPRPGPDQGYQVQYPQTPALNARGH